MWVKRWRPRGVNRSSCGAARGEAERPTNRARGSWVCRMGASCRLRIFSPTWMSDSLYASVLRVALVGGKLPLFGGLPMHQ